MRRTSSHSQSKNFTLKKRIYFAIFGSIVVLIIGLFIYVVSLLSSLRSFTISGVQISGLVGIESESLRASVIQSLQGKYLGLFSRANIFLYPRQNIEENLMQNYPEIDSVSLSRVGSKDLSVLIKEKDPAALVCVTYPDFHGSDLALNDPGTCYFADKSGYIFKKAPSFSGTLYHTYFIPGLVNDASSTDSVIGAYATSTAEFTKLQQFYIGVLANGIVVDAIFMKGNGDYELYARNNAQALGSDDYADTVIIYFNTLGSIDEQLSNLISFWNHMKIKKPMPKFSDIRLQYPPNVYYTESQ